MTRGAFVPENAFAGQSTNWAKLNRKTAFTWYSLEGAVCAEDMGAAGNRPARMIQRQARPLKLKRADVLKNGMTPFHKHSAEFPGGLLPAQIPDAGHPINFALPS